jgi:Na+/H+ antiporter NhaD/arsenite permease-like protein
VPSPIWILPFATLLLCVAILPLIPATAHWWHLNRNKLLVSGVLGLLVCAYYFLRAEPYDGATPGIENLKHLLHHALIEDYIPFIVLLFSLYTISGGIRVTGDMPAHPVTNALILGIGTLLASLIGTTGASMLLIRPLLQINRERRHVTHTVIFFIFMVSNIGGSLLPVGDPPLFLGYLRGVPFLWTLHLLPLWALLSALLLIIYYVWDTIMYRRETASDIRRDETELEPLRMQGGVNFPLLVGVVLAIALLVPGKPLVGTDWLVPKYLREAVQLGLAGLSMLVTRRAVRQANEFNFGAIGEVACLFVGIFITMMVPIEILKAQGAALGVDTPLKFFWATGMLSSFLDNAPTYVVFFELAGALPDPGLEYISGVHTATGMINQPDLMAIAAGAVFMGAMTYIGNGPNFLVKSIAEHSGVKMPGFFGYMAYSCLILLPLFALVSVIWFV